MSKSQGEAAPARLLEQLRSLKRDIVSATPGGNRQLVEAITALQSALDEVEAVEVELSQQNEELMAMREELEVERHRYQELFELAPDGYLVSDDHATVVEANRAAALLLNTSQRALRGKPLAVFIDPEHRPDFRSLVHGLRVGETRQDVEILLTPRGTAPRPAHLTVVRDEEKPGQSPRLRWVLRDISERKSTEEALRAAEERLRHSQKLESIGRLAGGIAHSFNNLLAAIAFHTELLLAGLEADRRLRHHAEEVQRAGERAATLARQLLAFGRKQVLQPRRLRLDQVIAGLEPMLRRLIGEHIRLDTDLDPDTGPVYVDLGQIEQVILNLVVNARDAMPDGGRLVLATENCEVKAPAVAGGEDLSPGLYVALSVQDSGTGIVPEIRERLFEPFFTTKEQGKGTGLGLATIYGIIRQSGGAIQVETEPGEGSAFTVLLPRATEAEDTAEITVLVDPAPTPAKGSELILLVEDEDNIREPAVEVLESCGYTVLAACDGAEALVLAKGEPRPIHLLVTDVIMPGMSGSQLADELVTARPELRVLFISGYPEDAISRHGVLSPTRAFLQKPFPPGVLLARVRDVLDGTVPATALRAEEPIRHVS